MDIKTCRNRHVEKHILHAAARAADPARPAGHPARQLVEEGVVGEVRVALAQVGEEGLDVGLVAALLEPAHDPEQHPLAAIPDLWLGKRGQQFGRGGLSRALRRRAKRAGVQRFRPHRLRHTAAHRWLAAGGSESGLMAIAGWTRTDMLVRYTRAGASARAAAEARRLDLGAI